MTIEQAKSILLSDYLYTIGYYPCKQQNHNLWYISPLRNESEPSFKVNLKRNEWYDFGIGKGGDIIAFVCELHQTDVGKALHILSGKPISGNSFSFRQKDAFDSFEDIMIRPLSNIALIDYLHQRGIPSDIATTQCKEVYYKLKGKPYFAVAFENEKGGCEIRNKYFKGSISPKAVTWRCNLNKTCCLFEGFMDYLSFLTLCKHNGSDPLKYDALILNSIANISHAVQSLRNYEQILGYLDNDTAGQRITDGLCQYFGNRFIDKRQSYSSHKDLNEYLSNQKEPQKQSVKPKRGFRL